ncbi:MAG: HDOD domain-containing protein [Candidatus Korobacteraceae bacterium]
MNSTGTAMDCPAQTRELDGPLAACSAPAGCGACSDGSNLASLVLPLLTRSSGLLNLLFQDGTVDLELASSVVALDPGLAFGTLQLANRDRVGKSNPIWLFPLAVVAAGRDLMLQLVNQAPRIESLAPSRRNQLFQLSRDAVLRASLAQLLTRELGECDPRKSFLAGLLLELPTLVKVALPRQSISPARLLATLCSALPSAVVTAALAGPASADRYDPLAPVGAIARIADSLVTSLAGGYSGIPPLERLASGPLWRFWSETNVRQRSSLLGHGLELAQWVSANLYRMDPWEFMARLESHKSWE